MGQKIHKNDFRRHRAMKEEGGMDALPRVSRNHRLEKKPTIE
jgi:hypothetical protein